MSRWPTRTGLEQELSKKCGSPEVRIWEFPRPQLCEGPYYEDPHEKDPRFTATVRQSCIVLRRINSEPLFQQQSARFEASARASGSSTGSSPRDEQQAGKALLAVVKGFRFDPKVGPNWPSLYSPATCEQSSILAYQGPKQIGIMQKVPKAIGPTPSPKRCPISPRLKRDYIWLEFPKAIPLFSAAPKPAKAIGPPQFIHGTGFCKQY